MTVLIVLSACISVGATVAIFCTSDWDWVMGFFSIAVIAGLVTSGLVIRETLKGKRQ